jgi:hypothetical protein
MLLVENEQENEKDHDLIASHQILLGRCILESV